MKTDTYLLKCIKCMYYADSRTSQFMFPKSLIEYQNTFDYLNTYAK